MNRLRLVIDSDLGDVPLVAVAVNRICLHLGLDTAGADEVELCVVEATTNAIRHAYHCVSGCEVEVTLSAGLDQLQFEVCDRGTPMSPAQADRVNSGAHLQESENIDQESLPEGGRGLQIIHELMDQVAYSHTAERNALVMTRRIAPRAAV